MIRPLKPVSAALALTILAVGIVAYLETAATASSGYNYECKPSIGSSGCWTCATTGNSKKCSASGPDAPWMIGSCQSTATRGRKESVLYCGDATYCSGGYAGPCSNYVICYNNG